MNYLNNVVDEKGEIDWYGFAQYYNFCESGVISHKLYGGVDGEYVIDLTSAIALPEELASIKSLLNDLRYEYYNKIIMARRVGRHLRGICIPVACHRRRPGGGVLQ